MAEGAFDEGDRWTPRVFEITYGVSRRLAPSHYVHTFPGSLIRVDLPPGYALQELRELGPWRSVHDISYKFPDGWGKFYVHEAQVVQMVLLSPGALYKSHVELAADDLRQFYNYRAALLDGEVE